MRIRDSEMPPEETWAKYFKPGETLQQFGLSHGVKDVADFGCGYGTFTIPAAQIIDGKIYALDIEPEMIKTIERKARESGLNNVVAVLRDFVQEGSGLEDSSVDFVFLFNILHAENPAVILKEAHRILNSGGKAGIIHWNYDEKIGDRAFLEILPKPEQCMQWAEAAGFHFVNQLNLEPYHFGLLMQK